MTETISTNQVYDAKSITVLRDLEAVKRRPAMYIGDVGMRGLHHLVEEVLDNSVDEAMSGYCNKIDIIVNQDGSISIEDNGRGIPVDMHPTEKRPAVEVVLTTLHAGGKFDHKAYKVSGGLHGVGITVTNALSGWLEVEVYRNGKVYFQRYEHGKPVTSLNERQGSGRTGTKITFFPDKGVFSDINFDYELLNNRARELAFLNKGLKISLEDRRTGKREEYCFTKGIEEFIAFLNKHKKVLGEKPIYFSRQENEVIIEVALQYSEGWQEHILSFANNINTIEGGTHLSGFQTALTRSINDYIKRNNISETKITGDDIREGLSAIINIKLTEPQFEGQTKTKLGNLGVKGVVDSIVYDSLSYYFEENPSIAKLIANKCVMSATAREAAKKARDLSRRKSILESGSLPGKLADCQEKDPSKCELFIVEGDSAAGTGISARNRKFQAILPLRGKILNVEKANIAKIFKSEQITNLITAIGCGVGEEFNLKKLRYHKVIILNDADVDGNHLACLLLTLFYRYMPKLIENIHIYIAQPPLFKVIKNKKTTYVRNEADLKRILVEIGKDNLVIQRFKGLGEMDANELEETVMNQETRSLKAVTIDDAMRADEMFSILMGGDVEPRRKFIQMHAREVRNLDV